MDSEHESDVHQPPESEGSPAPVVQQSGSRTATAKTSMCYHFILLVLLLAAELASITALVLFGIVHIQINNTYPMSTWSKCALFAVRKGESAPVDLGQEVWSCDFVLGGQIVLILFIAVFLIFYLILVIVRART